jgi:hypothetical protein
MWPHKGITSSQSIFTLFKWNVTCFSQLWNFIGGARHFHERLVMKGSTAPKTKEQHRWTMPGKPSSRQTTKRLHIRIRPTLMPPNGKGFQSKSPTRKRGFHKGRLSSGQIMRASAG